jgi:hypothetical protein
VAIRASADLTLIHPAMLPKRAPSAGALVVKPALAHAGVTFLGICAQIGLAMLPRAA